jgi:uncharacterized protein YbbC (DUF1343 family)
VSRAFQFGIDRLHTQTQLVAELRGARVALLAHAASVNRKLVHTSEALRELGINPTTYFGPEHGWAGHAQEMVKPGATPEAVLGGARVVSLYGERYEDLSPRAGEFDPVEAVIIDLQDVGARFYTVVWTAVLVARSCKAMGMRIIVLDRPNILGATVEGLVQDPRFLSFVGLEQVPIRHGLTIGQILAWRSRVEGYSELFTLVRAIGMAPDDMADSWDRPLVMPSPNMPTFDTALVYPGACLVEGTNLSEGRGTTRPFELVGAPWLNGYDLARQLMGTGLRGFVARPVTFQPMYNKHAGTICSGVQIHVTDRRAFRPVRTYTTLIALAHHANPEQFVFRTERYEFVDDIPAFDLLTGSAVARQRILAGDEPLAIAIHAAAVGPDEMRIVNEARHGA